MVRTALLFTLRPLLWLFLGVSVGNRERLPLNGPAIVAANHNSHADIVILAAAFHRRAIPLLTPVGAADYFMRTRLLRFVALHIVGMLPIARTVTRRTGDPLAAARAALEAGRILIVFPEGTRGQPEELGVLKAGVTKLARDANLPIVPVYLQGAGRILPKGARLPVPFTCTMLVGEPIAPGTDRAALLTALGDAFTTLQTAAPPLYWD